ncbi:MAG: carboxypeptidase-like regulatory domain-containing protein, partial [Planctomycetota bacterium]
MSSKSASRFEPLEGDPRSVRSRSRLRALTAFLVLAASVWFLARGTGLRRPARPGPEPAGPGTPPRAVFRPLELAGKDDEGPAAERSYAFSALAARPVPLAGQRIEFLAGRVVGLVRRGVAGARAASESHAAVTDDEGRFALPRTFGPVRVEHPEHFPRTLDGGAFPVNVARVAEAGPAGPLLLLLLEDAPEEMEIVLRPGSRISGIVRDERGDPVAGARVQFGEDEGSPETSSGPDGAYASPLLRHGILRVSAAHPEYQPASEMVTIAAPGLAARCEFTLVRGDKLRVHARDLSGQPVAGASVWIRFGGAAPPSRRRPGDPVFASPPEETGLGEWRYLGRTDDLGTLETRRDPTRAAAVRVAAPEHAEETAAAAGD